MFLKKWRSIFCASFVFFISLGFVPTAQAVPVAPYFLLLASQGQGVDSNTFYQGRCFRVNINLNTGGLNTNGADVEINYNSDILQVVQSDCVTAAATIYSDGLFNVYPAQGNSVGGNKIRLSAYNNPGVSTNSANGTYGHYFVKVLSGVGDHTMSFQYTQDLTTDTNLAETNGDGSDVLTSVGDLVLNLAVDNDDPTLGSLSPVSGATGVALNANLSFSLLDTMAGVNSSAVTARMRSGSGSWHNQTVSVGSALSTNQNRYYQYTGNISPNSNIKTNSGYYQYNTSYTAEVTLSDLGNPTVHSHTETWSFTTEDDSAAPYVDTRSPADNAVGVSSDGNVSFHVKDYKSNAGVIGGLGVDVDTITIRVSGDVSGVRNLTCASSGVVCVDANLKDITVTVNPEANFAENETVTVTINASDLHSPANTMVPDMYSFTTADSAAPTISSISPAPYSISNTSTTNVSFHLVDGGSGVDLSSLLVNIDGEDYSANSDQTTVSGDASDYLVTINPDTNFVNDRAVVVKVSVRDQASTPNNIDPYPYEYNFIVGLSTTTEQSEACPVCPSYSCGGGGVVYIKEPQVCPAVPVCEKTSSAEPTVIIKEVCSETAVPSVLKDVFSQPTGSNTKPAEKEVKIDNKTSSTSSATSSAISTVAERLTQNELVYSPSTEKSKDWKPRVDKGTFILILLLAISFLIFTRDPIGRIGFSIIAGVVLLNMFSLSLVDLKGKIDQSPLSGKLVNKVKQIVPPATSAITIKGQLVDIYSQKPLANYSVAVGDQRVVTGIDGKFELSNVDGFGRLKIYGGSMVDPAYFGLNGNNNLTININDKLHTFIGKVEKDYRANKYRNLYDLLAKAEQENISVDIFTTELNKQLLSIGEDYKTVDSWIDTEVVILDKWSSKITQNKYENVAQIKFVRKVINADQDVFYVEELWYIVKENGENRLAF